jgi:hypothetical protein
MTSYDELPISQAHRKVIEARAKFYADRPDELGRLPEKVRAAAPSLGECLAHYGAAEDLYSLGFELFDQGFGVTGEIALTLAAGETAAAHACIDAIIHENPFK